MTCEVFAAGMEAWLAGDGEPAAEAGLVQHAAACSACRQRWAEATTIRRAVGPLEPGDEALVRARARLRSAYADMGRPPIRFGRLKTPVGLVYVGLSDRGVCDVTFGCPTERAYRARLARRAPEIWEDPGALEPVLHELDAYFSGTLRQFSVPVDLRSVSAFTARVLQVTCDVPFGRLVSYGELASRLGSARASRAVGGALGRNPVPIIVPCHRVVAQGGRIGGYTGGLDTKRVLLRIEGTLASVK